MKFDFKRMLYKLEYKYGRYAIHSLMVYVMGATLAVAIFQLATNINVTYYLELYRDFVFRGQIWRLLTFIFIPHSSSVLMLITLYCYYMIGSMLENVWGAFKFNVYYFIGIISVIIGSFIGGYGTISFVNLSLFLVFAYLNPNMQFLLFFVIPIKAKYMAYFSWAMLAVQLLVNSWPVRICIIASMLNFFLFFGKDVVDEIRSFLKFYKQRSNYRKSIK